MSISIRKVAVLGAGVMGAQIAAHCINARVPVVLFDLPTEGRPNAIAEKAVAGLVKLKPAPFGDAGEAGLIELANYDSDLGKLAGCDLVIEAIAERLDWKRALYEKVAPHLAPHAIFATNTSGLPLAQLSEGFDAELARRFVGVHFFNPPRYMHLAELIALPATEPDILDALETFLTHTLGKGVVHAKDTPNFVGNRVGVFSILSAFHHAARLGLGYDVIDDLTGSKLGRAKSGTFRTADVVGLDTLAHVIATMERGLPDDPFRAHFGTPAVLRALIDKGALGQKTGAGFYRKDGKAILRLDPAKGEYVPAGGKADEIVGRMLKKPAPERFRLLRESSNPQAQFLWSVFRDVWHYIAVHLGDIARSAREIDLAIRFGFGWTEGPFETWQNAGWKQIAGWIAEDIAAGKAMSDTPLPAWVNEIDAAHGPEGSWSASEGRYVRPRELPVYERQIFRASLAGDGGADPRTAGTTVFEDDAIRLWHADGAGRDEVLIASFKTKMNTIGPGVIAGLHKGIELAEANYKGLVIWQPASLSGGPFSAGADLQAMLPAFMAKGPAGIEPAQKALQDVFLRLRYASVPTVAALAGIVLGGGCELAVHCAKRVAHLESYVGLVEIGVGLLPGGGGSTYLARRAAELTPEGGDLLPALKTLFTNVAMANVGTSALESRRYGYLLPDDPVVLNIHELLSAAIETARGLHGAGYRPPLPGRTFAVAGRSAIATIRAQLANLRDGGLITAYDEQLASTIAEVMCGGQVEAGSIADEATLLALERKHFGRLLGNPKTQERIMSLLNGGKPVRN
ncbi:3-hydroxyacyl-CoA dehydrogenase/enoyl-CoA hydratase family protein [Derxia gummosa]|uniref:3-hydroxyacyl-CoA dehydrogenase/enoyl-CoA hydratase family protein n=1 Tax=Derxia gummosa DSM 723 TaxID=1121388 RepID=A0A8B6X8P0_9BURK|nr:3-hydroxyacyl-CoA dehydrogenase/enoyl-CoA hydratase family protein [Derxia gummosa]